MTPQRLMGKHVRASSKASTQTQQNRAGLLSQLSPEIKWKKTCMNVWFLLLPSVYQVFPWKFFSLGCEDVSNLCQQLFRRRTWLSKTDLSIWSHHKGSQEAGWGSSVCLLTLARNYFPVSKGALKAFCLPREDLGGWCHVVFCWVWRDYQIEAA